MNEREFKKFLGDLASNTIRHYVISVKKFEKWLFKYQAKKRLEEANEADIRNWRTYLQKEKRIATYFYGIKKYYLYTRNSEMVNAIDETLKKLRPSRPRRGLISWVDFTKMMSKAEESGIKTRDYALLNLLWSEIPSKEILRLYISDIDFEKRLITSPKDKRKIYRVTRKAWDTLQKYVQTEDRGKRTLLFPKIRSNRSVQKIAKKYFESVRQTPKSLMLSCREDLIDAGKTVRFVTESKKKLSSKEKEQARIARNLFDKLAQEIKEFGNRVHERIEQIKDEEELRRLLEGYLLATFPNEIITREFHFKAVEDTDSIIDFAVGKHRKIPIEVKLARKKRRIEPYWREGLGQVSEFLKRSGSKKGILVIGDQNRDPERQKLSGTQDNIHIIII